MNILVTGGSGGLARFICQEFADHHIMLMDRVPPPPDRANLPFVQGDLTVFEDCQRAIAACQPEAILALAAIPWPSDDADRRAKAQAAGRVLPPPDLTMNVNVMGLYYLLMAAAEAGVKKVIQTSSIVGVLTFGLPIHYLPIDERHPGFAVNSYNYSKIVGEWMCQWFTRSYGMQTICMRPAWNIPPEQLQRHAKDVQPTTSWSGILWHYVDTRDVARAHRLAFDALDRLPSHDSFLVHAPDHMAPEESRQLVSKFRPDLLSSIPVYLQGRGAFVSCEKARNAFGYRGRYSWTDFL
jgi:nucleoside-diphosphate-sugar epimerase